MRSSNKKTFLDKHNSGTESLEMTAEELTILARRYEKKHGIKLIVNGESAFGQKIIKEHDKLLQADQCLDRDEVKKEISEIQHKLNEGELVGYFYTNNHRVTGGHFEVLIISKDNVIRPIDWGIGIGLDQELSEMNINGKFTNAFVRLFIKKEQDRRLEPQPGEFKIWSPRICAQVSSTACGSLSVMYIRELLKNKAQQLHEFTLIIPSYREFLGKYEDHLHHFFFPSPQVLRYSQSTAYNKAIVAMLSDKDSVIFNHSDSIYTVRTLKNILETTRTVAQLKNNDALAQECTKMLSQLPDFKERWLKAYEAADAKRQTMDIKGRNQYLAYTRHRLYGIALENKAYRKKVKKRLEESQPKKKK